MFRDLEDTELTVQLAAWEDCDQRDATRLRLTVQSTAFRELAVAHVSAATTRALGLLLVARADEAESSR